MSTLTASHLLSSHARLGSREAPRLGGLRVLFRRMADASRAAGARCAMGHLNDHMLRDLGLTRGDLDAL